VTNPFEEESDKAKDALDAGADGEKFKAAKRSGGDVERSGGDVEAPASGGDVESTGTAHADSGGDVESDPV
jgi:hypothetical protein